MAATSSDKVTDKVTDTWPTYPRRRYWHEVIANPRKRPFAVFMHATPTAPPHIPTKAELAREERERQWRATQAYYYRTPGVGMADLITEPSKVNESISSATVDNTITAPSGRKGLGAANLGWDLRHVLVGGISLVLAWLCFADVTGMATYVAWGVGEAVLR